MIASVTPSPSGALSLATRKKGTNSVLLSSWSLWSATGMLMTAVNICYGYEEDRSFVRFNIEALLLGAALGAFGAVALGLVALFPVLVDLLPLSDSWHATILLVRWPILAALAIVALAVVYRYAPARIPQEWSWFSWGAATATALWLIGSVVFNFYVSKFGSYEKTYGSLGAVVVLLLWFYMSTYVILIGAELNAEIERYCAARMTRRQR